MMAITSKQQKYVALLRGINVGGKHKVPMAELRKIFEELGFANIKTLLNSGNVIFDGATEKIAILEEKISSQLEKSFGFSIPVLVKHSNEIQEIVSSKPFDNIEIHKDIRLFVTFIKEPRLENIDLPHISSDGSFQIINVKGQTVYGVLDLSKSKTPDAMKILEKLFGKSITSRSWETTVKIRDSL